MKIGPYDISEETMFVDFLLDEDKPLTILNTGTWRIIRPVHRDRLAPCMDACTASIKIRDYLALIAANKVKEAWELLLTSDPLPSITGRICPHPCEKACNRGQFDEEINIQSIEHFLGDWGLENSKLVSKPLTKEKVAIVGSGIAGLTAAYYLVNEGYRVTVLESMPEAGQLLRYGTAYKQLEGVLEKQIAFFKKMGVEITVNAEIAEPEDLLKRGYKAVFFGSSPLGVEAEGRRTIDRSRLPTSLAKDKNGMVTVNPVTLVTDIAGVFAGGDVISDMRRANDLVGSGRQGAISIDRFLRKVDMEEGRIMEKSPVVQFNDLNIAYFKKAPQKTVSDEASAIEEASRCFYCGACNDCGICWFVCPDGVVVKKAGHFQADLDWCKGCGLCGTECPRGAILMEDEIKWQ